MTEPDEASKRPLSGRDEASSGPSSHAEGLLRLAGRVGDGTPVDWDAELARDPGLADDASGLRNVERLAAAHAQIAREAAPDGPELVGSVLLHYRIVDRIGSGAMGTVYRAKDERLPRQVAIKLLRPSRLDAVEARDFLLHEARLACSVVHPNVATIIDVGESGDRVFIVMEWVDGTTLADAIRDRPLPPSTVIEYGAQIASALQAIHDAGVVHRDLKCANVTVATNGLVKVLDFGIAVRSHAPREGTGAFGDSSYGPAGRTAGTPAYMAPELLRGGGPDARSDIWALGVTLYELLSRRKPFAAQNWPDLERAVQGDDPADLPAATPEPLRRVIGRCLKKDPGQRYHHAAEVRAALEAIQVPKPRRVPFAVAVGAGLLLAAGVIFAVGKQGEGAGGCGHPAQRSLVVLPARNASGAPGQQFLADGLTDQLINTFSRLAPMRVFSRTTSYAIAREEKPLPALAREHSLDVVLESSVAQAGDRVRVNVELVDARSDRQIWAQSYECPLREALSLDRSIVRGVATCLKIPLSESDLARLEPAPPVDFAVYRAYVLGRNHKAERRYSRALECYAEAARIDSTFAPAYAGMADCYTEMAYYQVLPPQEALPRAAAAASRALAIDSTLGSAHLALAYVSGIQWDWARSKAELDRAQEEEPGNPEVWYGRSFYLGVHGHAGDAVEAMERAVELDPLSIRYASELGLAYLNAGRVDDAAAQFRRVEREGKSDEARRARAYEARCLVLQGKAAEGVARLRPPSGSAATTWEEEEIAYALARAGRKPEALKVVARLSAGSGGARGSPLAIAAAQLAAGEREAAWTTLDRACEARDPRIIWLGVDQRFDPLRGDPRYVELMRRVGLGAGA